MEPLADALDLGRFLQDDTIDPDVASLLLVIASGLIRSHVGWSITQETGVEFSTEGTGTDVIWLPTKHLTVVQSVEVDGVLLAFPDQYRWKTSGRLRRVGGTWPCVEQSVDVVFDHGYVAPPDDVLGVCLTVAARLHNNPEGLRTWSVDGLSETTAGPATDAGLMLSELEKKALDPYLLTGVA